jgi:hypothetical protein
MLLRKHFGDPILKGGDRIWYGVPGYVEVRVVDDKLAVRATREMPLPLVLPASVRNVIVSDGKVEVAGATLDHCAATLHYLDETAVAGEKLSVTKLRRRIEGRVYPCWHRRLA